MTAKQTKQERAAHKRLGSGALPVKRFDHDGRPLVSPADAPADGFHPLQDRPYAPSLIIAAGWPTAVQRHTAYPVTSESVVRVLTRLGWNVIAYGEWHADAFAGDPCFQLLTVRTR